MKEKALITDFLSKTLTHGGMIRHYIMKEDIFVVIFYKLLEQQMYWNAILKSALKLMVNWDD